METRSDRCRQIHPLPTRDAWFFALVRLFFMTTLLGYILFAHGCHGDEDHELFVRAVRWVWTGGCDRE